MKTLSFEITRLRWPLLGLLCSSLLATLLVMGANHFGAQAAQAAQVAEQQAQRMRDDAQRLKREEAELRAKIGEYHALLQHGIIGPEKRLDWVELIRTLQTERRLLGLEYEIYPQLPLSSRTLKADLGSHTYHSSAMHLIMPLLHEEDLTRFVGDLQARAPAMVRIRSCKVLRGATAHADEYTIPPLLHADCMLEWITLQEKRNEGTPQ